MRAPVRPKNEDALGFREQPIDAEEWRRRARRFTIICDGVGGQGDGDRAGSQLAVEKALEAYRVCRRRHACRLALLRPDVRKSTANLAVYDASMEGRDVNKRMATTMTIALFRHHEVHIGHVGDCRAYHIHGREISRVTTDHSYTGMQMKLGLINAQEAANSDLRCVLTRSVGRDPTVQVDFYTIQVNPGDCLVQCCDGVYTCISEQEIRRCP